MSLDGHPPYFPLYPNDFTADRNVEAMETLEVGAYFLLLCKAWYEDPPASLPNNDRLLARWARLTSDQWAACKDGVLAAFTLGKDGRLHQKRLRREYDKMKNYINSKSVAGRIGAEKRWQSHNTGNGCAIAEPMANDGSSSSSSSSTSVNPPCSPPPAEKRGKECRKKAERPRVSSMDAAAYRAYVEAGMKAFVVQMDRSAWPRVDVGAALARAKNFALGLAPAERKQEIGRFLMNWLNADERDAQRKGAPLVYAGSGRVAECGEPAATGAAGRMDAGGRKQENDATHHEIMDEETLIEEWPPAGAEQAAGWDDVMTLLTHSMDRDSFDTWIRPAICRRLARDGILLAVPSTFYRNWVLNTYADQIVMAAMEALGMGALDDFPELRVEVGWAAEVMA